MPRILDTDGAAAAGTRTAHHRRSQHGVQHRRDAVVREGVVGCARAGGVAGHVTNGGEAATEAGTREAVDPITLEVINQRLQSIADEMETVLCRSAFSSIVKEAMDASAALFDHAGNTLAQAAALPGHLGTVIPARWALQQKTNTGGLRNEPTTP